MYGGQIEKEFQVASFNRNQQIERHIPGNEVALRKGFVAQLKSWTQSRRQPGIVSERVASQQTMQAAH